MAYNQPKQAKAMLVAAMSDLLYGLPKPEQQESMLQVVYMLENAGYEVGDPSRQSPVLFSQELFERVAGEPGGAGAGNNAATWKRRRNWRKGFYRATAIWTKYSAGP